MGWRMYFLEEKNVNSKTVFDVSRYSDLYDYLIENISYGNYSERPKLVTKEELYNVESEVKKDLEKAKFRLVVNMAQNKDVIELQNDFEYYEELFRVSIELEALQRIFYNLDTLYCWIG